GRGASFWMCWLGVAVTRAFPLRRPQSPGFLTGLAHERFGHPPLSRVASRTFRAYVQAAVGERGRAVGSVGVQTFGSVAHRRPHLHVLKTAAGRVRAGSAERRAQSR